jgi:RNA polymerase sigma factor (sigma-70 family)
MSLDDLLFAARAGDAKAEQRLYRKLRRDLVKYFRRRAPSNVTEDLTQQTLMIVIRESKTFEPTRPGAFRSFVFETAFNQLRSYRRRESLHRRERDAPGTWAVEPPEVSEVMLELERRRLLQEALAIVRTTFRRVLESRLRGDDPRDYAEAEGLELGSVRSRVRRAILAVREVLAARRKTRGPTPKPS